MKCQCCKTEVHPQRYALGYRTCLACGESQARSVRHTVAIPYSKGAYQLITDPNLLKFTNPKR